MTLVVDASVALKCYRLENGAEPARQILADGDTLVAPELVVAECATLVGPPAGGNRSSSAAGGPNVTPR